MLVPLAPTVVPELQHMSTVNDLKDGVMGDSGDIVERNDRSLPAVPHSWRERERATRFLKVNPVHPAKRMHFSGSLIRLSTDTKAWRTSRSPKRLKKLTRQHKHQRPALNKQASRPEHDTNSEREHPHL
jgi:hypothetical protein